MKLTCVIIVVALFLTACHAKDKQEHPAVRGSDDMQDSEDLKLAKKCTVDSDFCDPDNHDCCSGRCIDEGGSGVCAIVPVLN
uniref:Conotoxin ArMKLT2-01 n=1 Tax=Conus arenatus TaxID=89451 RepID=O1619_CONAE|nr:RecName: Full=Conotoxin ArMKLT2-01; Flags: Precursor [Conus arenatus]AAG60489.1 conotoxin scaffold VI/VII precursor [Conus arenatus]